MGADTLNPLYMQAKSADNWDALTHQQLEDSDSRHLVRTLLCALLLAVCCPCLFKWHNRRQKPPEVREHHALTENRCAVPVLGSVTVERQPDDVIRCIDGPKGQTSLLAFLADGKHIICACKAEKTIQMLNAGDCGGTERLTNLTAAVNVIASVLSKDGELIVTGDVDGKVVVWDTSFQKRYEGTERHRKRITALNVSSSLLIASGSIDGRVVVWEMGEPGHPLVQGLSMDHTPGLTPVSSVQFSVSGRHIASACGCTIEIWHSRTGHRIISVPVPNNLPAYSLAWSSDGHRLFAGCYGGSIKCFNTVTGKPFSEVIETRPGDDSITSLHISGSDQFLISFSAPARTIDIWDIRNTPACKPLRTYNRCASLSLSSDNLYLASSSSGDDSKISIRSLFGVVEASSFLHCLAPSANHPEPFTYISPVAHQAWKSGKLAQVEPILSREIEEKRFQGFKYYAHANRALVRVRLGNLDGALDDVDMIMRDGTQIPPIAHIVRAMALIGQGRQSEAMEAFGCVCRNDTENYVEYIKSVILLELELRDRQSCEEELTWPPPLTDVHPCAWVETHKLLLLARYCMQRKAYRHCLQYLAKAPDLSPFFHVPEAKITWLVFGWNMYDLECMCQQLRWQALFASGRTQEVGHLPVNKNCLDEEDEVRKADLGWLSEKLGDEAMRHNNFDDAIAWYSLSLDLCPDSRLDDCGSEFAKDCLSAIEITGHDITDSSEVIAQSQPSDSPCL